VALYINTALLVVAGVMFVLSVAYSHPAIRLKARPWLGLLTVSLGQGIGGAVAGWLCGQGNWMTLGSTRALLGLAVSTLITTGFYPLTQIYQRAEDARRGDITFAVRMGERCFPFTIVCFTAAAGLAARLLWREFSPAEGLLVGAGLLGLAGLVAEWWRHFDEAQTRQSYERLMRIGYVMGVGFILYIGWHLVARA
jgi:4-hydroxybenzoate polyprenyltransferase